MRIYNHSYVYGNFEVDTTYLLKGAFKATSDPDMDYFRVVNVEDPVDEYDAVNKRYVDALLSGISLLEPVRVAATTEIDIYSDPVTIDGVSLVDGDRVLLTNQSMAYENGIYVYSSGGYSGNQLARIPDVYNIKAGSFVFVTEGTTNADVGYLLTSDGTNGDHSIDSDDQTWSKFTSIAISAGTGLTKSGTVINVDNTVVPFKYAEVIPNGSTSATITHNLGVDDVVVSVRNISTGEVIYPTITYVDNNSLTVTFTEVIPLNTYRIVVMG